MYALKNKLKNIFQPWRRTTNALFYQQRTDGKKIKDLTFKVNELELSLESFSARTESSTRGSSSKKSS